jgi:hypothetical protein
MKNLKSFLAKHFLILAFAVGGIFAVTSNVTVSGNNPPETGTDTGEDCTSTTRCNPAMGDYTSEFSGKNIVVIGKLHQEVGQIKKV